MKRHLAALACASLLLVAAAPARAGDASSCESISDSDSRNHCRAVAKRDKSYCESIGNSDRRNYCRGVAGRDRSACESISDSNLRNRCRAEAN